MVQTHILHTAKLHNNCPECFANNGLEFTFSQQETAHKLYVKAAPKIHEKLVCNTCNNTIYPVNWDKDIDRVYEYHKKQVVPIKSTIRLTKIGYIVVSSLIICIACLLIIGIQLKGKLL